MYYLIKYYYGDYKVTECETVADLNRAVADLAETVPVYMVNSIDEVTSTDDVEHILVIRGQSIMEPTYAE